MDGIKGYRTRQRESILSCLKANGDRHVTVEMIADFLQDRGERVGQTTIYRNLDKLVGEGRVLKFAAPSGAGACYRYVDPDAGSSAEYHLVCTGCGQMTHMRCEQIDSLFAHIRQEHRFIPDGLKTILYGRCERCPAQ